MKEYKKDKLTVKVMATRTEMGEVAARDIHDRILDYAVIAAFFAVMIGVGVYCSRKWMDGLERS